MQQKVMLSKNFDMNKSVWHQEVNGVEYKIAENGRLLGHRSSALG